MTKRFLLTLCACLALAIGMVFWLGTKPSLTASVQVPVQDSGEQLADLRQETNVTLVNGGEREQSQTTKSTAPMHNEDDASVSSNAPSVRVSGNVNASDDNARATNAKSQDDVSAPRLSAEVFAVIEDVQQKQMDGKWEESLLELNVLYEDFDQLNSFEQTTLLNFYTNTLVRFEMWPEAIGAFSRLLTVPDLRPDLGARALMALGQLHAQVGEYAASITYLTSWQELTVGMENMERSNERVAQLLAQSRIAAQQASLEEQ